jgi:signal transduction histidine kinase/GAF domain-containing protein
VQRITESKGLFLSAVVALTCSLGFSQNSIPTRHRNVLILSIDQPTRPFARELLYGIQEATRDATGVSLFVEFLGPTALETESVAIQRQHLLAARYAGQPIELIVAIGDRAVGNAEKLRDDLFPSAKLLFLVSSIDIVRTSVRQGEGLHIDSGALPSLQLALSLMPERSRLIVVSGASGVDQMWRRSIADSLQRHPGKIDATYLNGVPLPELLEMARHFPADSMIVVTTNMVDRSGRATSNIDLVRELSNAARVPLIEGTDLSLGLGSLGGDLAAYQLTGEELGKRIRRMLDTGQAPAGVVIDSAPRRKAMDWRQLQRFGIPDSRVPKGFEILYRQPTLWEQHHDAITVAVGALLLQMLLISFLLVERHRRADAQASLRQQLALEAVVSKASLGISAATGEELPARLQEIALGLSESIKIERLSVWIYLPEELDYAAIHWWPESKMPMTRDAIVQRFPYMHRELQAGRIVTAANLDELPFGAASDVAELRAQGFLSVLMIPLKLGGIPIGGLILGTYSHVAKWDKETRSNLQVLANVLAQGISRSMAEERERRSEEQNRAMLASLPGFVVMIDGSGQILRQSNRLGLSATELPRALVTACLGCNLIELWGSEGEDAGELAQALERVLRASQTSFALEHRYQTETGPRWIEVHGESLCGLQHGAVVSHIDITQRKKTESENAQHRQTAWHLNRVAALGELTASLAHEINQPLAAILNSAEAAAALLNRQCPDIRETLEAVKDIIDDDKRAGAVIQRMRSMLRRAHERTQSVDLNATVNETLRLVVNEARLRHVTLHHIPAPDLPPVIADSTQLQQVILNLITNGIEAAEMMPNQRQVEIRSTGGADGIQLLEVQDSGPGIRPEMLSKIFEPFYTSKREGLGLGLSICRSIVESVGGKIGAESLPAGGAVFRVSLRTAARAYEGSEQALRASV